MPLPVPHVRWRCLKCGKSRWLKPFDAKHRRYCSRRCQYAAARVDDPVRPVPGAKKTFGERSCDQCGRLFTVKKSFQRFCSHACALAHVHERNLRSDRSERGCEHCGTVFTPLHGNAGRFCSRRCFYEHQKGPQSPVWRGGRLVTANGYVKLRMVNHPSADKGGYVAEHRLVMEQKLGRRLERHETVHHINGDRSDNRPENLQVRSGRHGHGRVLTCADCGSTNVVAKPIA